MHIYVLTVTWQTLRGWEPQPARREGLSPPLPQSALPSLWPHQALGSSPGHSTSLSHQAERLAEETGI